MDRPYTTRFVVQALQGKAKFCNISKKDTQSCDPTELVSQLEFGYSDTKRGFLEGRIVALESGKIEFAVRKLTDKNPLPGTKKTIQVRHPLRLSTITPYYESIMLALKNGWWNTDRGYTGEHLELTGERVRALTFRVLTFKMFRSGTDTLTKKQWMRKMVEYRINSKDFGLEIWTRGAFANHLLDTLAIPKTLGTAVWNDESGVYQSTIHTLRTRYRFEWQDRFPTYFQPDKKITLGEALYLIERVVGR